MTADKMKKLKVGDLVKCKDAVMQHGTRFPHRVIDKNDKYISCRATSLRKSASQDINGDNLSCPDTNMYYGYNHAHHLEEVDSLDMFTNDI